jgi:hypothetical protein
MPGYLFERHDDALAASEVAETCRLGMRGNALEPVWCVYDCLIRLTVVRGAPSEEHGRVLDLVEAERARVLGDDDEAIMNYGRASILAQEQGFVHEAALADELAARFWAEQGNQDDARLHLERAHRGYRRWQAWAKVAVLEAKHPLTTPDDGANGASSYWDVCPTMIPTPLRERPPQRADRAVRRGSTPANASWANRSRRSSAPCVRSRWRRHHQAIARTCQGLGRGGRLLRLRGA